VPVALYDGIKRQRFVAEEVRDVDCCVGLASVVVCQQAHVGEGPAQEIVWMIITPTSGLSPVM
jgi:hypothetical protein